MKLSKVWLTLALPVVAVIGAAALVLLLAPQRLIKGIKQGLSEVVQLDTEETVNQSAFVVEGIRDLGELATAEMTHSVNVTVFAQNSVMSLPVGQTEVIVSVIGIVRAGIDFSQIQLDDLNIEGATIYVRLPPAKILASGIDAEASAVIHSAKEWFGPNLQAELFDLAQEDAQAKMLEVAQSSDLLSRAERNAQNTVRDLLSSWGQFTVEFTDSIDPASVDDKGDYVQ
jgi:hypothetical protein